MRVDSATFSLAKQAPAAVLSVKRMKTAYSLLVLIATIGFAHAGGFGGPPPFTNGSPLQSGVDGTYQASIRGSNLSGVIQFSYSSGTQSSGTWFIFYQGQAFFGGADVAIMNASIAGVMDTFTTQVDRISSTTNANGSSSTEVDYLTGPNGSFTATLDNNSPNGSFSGNGELAVIAEVTVTQEDAGGNVISETINTETYKTKFKVKGVRITI